MPKFPEMDWSKADLPEEYCLFKQRMLLCLEDQGVTDKKKMAVKVKIAIGTEGLKRLNTSDLTDEDKEDPAKLWTLLGEQLKTNVNFRIHRMELMRYRQKTDESLDAFVVRCRDKAKYCEFVAEDLSERIVELVISSTSFDMLQRDLLEKPKGLKIADLLAEGRKYEAVAAGKQCLQTLDTKSVDAVTKTNKQCGNCGLSHAPRQCPAYHDKCKSCGSMSHWAKFCRKSNKSSHQPTKRSPSRGRFRGRSRGNYHSREKSRPRFQKKVDEIQGASAMPYTDEDGYEFHAITISALSHRDNSEAFTNVHVICPNKTGKHRLSLKIDTGAGGNTLPLRTMRQMYGDSWKKEVLPTTTKLSAYNGTAIECFGTINLMCSYKDSDWKHEKFYVVDVPGPAVAGLPACQQLRIVTIHSIQEKQTTIRGISDLTKKYPENFDSIGSFKGTAKLLLKDDAEPHIDAPRKCSIHIKEKLRLELSKMEQQGVIRHVDHHTDWCSSITTSVKKDGSVRVCLDPKRLNDSLRRCPHKIPTTEELNPALAKAKVFSKLDAKAGYWSVHLDKESQELTTFRTPFGRYCYQRLPFGLSVSQDIFQQRMDEIIEKVNGCVGIADDLIIYGVSDADHDANLINLMETAREAGLVFNSAKCTIRATEIEFFGSVYSTEGIRPDPSKVEGIQGMPTPQDADDLRKFMGLMTYMSCYISRFAAKSKPLRDLLKKEVPFDWQDDHQKAFDDLKEALTNVANLQYYNTEAPTVLETDASSKGLGACLLQNGKPIAFASKSLSSAETNYSNIERETLAIVFGIQRFHTYLFGKEFELHTDHKPLEMIWKKPLISAPPRLQRLLIKIQGYKCKIIYKPGASMVLSDTLSRLPNPSMKDDVPLDICVEGISLDIEDNAHIDLVHFGSSRREALKIETMGDPTLRELAQVVNTGWPDHIKELPTNLRPYWSYRDELGVSSGVLFKGRQVLVPETQRRIILEQLHASHQGIEKTRRLARESVFWPNINDDIERMTKSCSHCQEMKPCQKKEPLMCHDIPPTPWTKLGTDLFEIKGENYLLITDYTSKYPVVYRLNNTTSATVASLTSKIFSMFGAPAEVVSDNGPQFTGRPYKEMLEKYGVKHTTSSPRYPQSNGLAERMVQTVKNTIKKTKKSGTDLDVALMDLRATPVDQRLPSPAEMLFGRQIRTCLPSNHPIIPSVINQNHMEERRQTMANQQAFLGRTELPPLIRGQRVRVLDQASRTWIPATVTRVLDQPRSYEVATPNGSTLRRNRSHLREVPNTRQEPRRVRFEDDKPLESPSAHQGSERPPNTQRAHETHTDTQTPTSQPPTVQLTPAPQNSSSNDTTQSKRPQRVRKQPSHLQDFVTR